MISRSHVYGMVGLAITLLGGCAPHTNPPKPASIDAIKKSIAYLSNDSLDGRGIGTEGLETAAQYLAGYFRGLDLGPVPGQSDYFQLFPYTTVDGLDPQTNMSLGPITYVTSTDFVPFNFSAETTCFGPVVFAGYGVSGAASITDPAIIYDDYKDLDVKGKIVLVMRFEPVGDPAQGQNGGRQRRRGSVDCSSTHSPRRRHPAPI
jgi:hypothetical protein